MGSGYSFEILFFMIDQVMNELDETETILAIFSKTFNLTTCD